MLQNEMSLLAILFLQSATGKVKEKYKGLELNGKHERLVYDDEFNVLCKGKGIRLPRTGHEGPEGSRCIALLFLQHRR